MLTFLNFALAIVGSSSLAVAVFILIDNPLQRIWSRHWLRQRLDNSRTLREGPETLSPSRISSRSRKSESIIDEEMANFLDAMAREMHLGRSLTSALLHAHSSHPLLAIYIGPMALSCERGVSITEVLRASESTTLTTAMPSCILFGIRAMWAATTGSAGALALERAATTLRERTAIHYERRAQSAQARLSVKILTWLPIAFLGWQLITNPLARWFLLVSPIGWTLLAGGLGLNWFGRCWMNRIVMGTA
ncbi:MAG: hypothetical protein IAG10_05615 [Planctomycetaceae bacterium]|nr:hypothetical protein [Planctomycetaceae bacterium]